MPDHYSRRSFLSGVIACGTLSASASYLLRDDPAAFTLVLATGDDTTGARQHLVDLWNERHPDVKLALHVVPGDTIGQKKALSNMAREPAAADIINLDVIHVPEFARQGLIREIELEDPNEFLDGLVFPVRNDDAADTYWAAPFNTDVGMMFQRFAGIQPDPRVVPLSEAIGKRGGDGSGLFTGQLRSLTSASHEAFVINVLEQALAVDVDLVSTQGEIAYRLPRWVAALRPLRRYVDLPGTPLADDEDDTVRRFKRDPRLEFMRNWPVKYRDLQKDGLTEVGPSWVGVGELGAGILGGQCLAVVKDSRHPREAEEAVRFLTATPAQTAMAPFGLAPTRRGAYDDANVKLLMGHLDAVRGAVEGSRPRPVHHRYAEFSAVVYRHVYEYLYRQVELGPDFITDMQLALA